jgi:hypothetical protein
MSFGKFSDIEGGADVVVRWFGQKQIGNVIKLANKLVV